MFQRWRTDRAALLALGAITLVGLGLRLLAWRWHEFRPLGGDEREYLDLAIHLAQGKGYYDLQFMRPPLFPIGLAALVWLFDGDLQLLRLANLLVSAATIPLIWWWTRALLGRAAGPERSVGNGIPLLAAGLAALSYTLALNATELLTEAVTLFGLTAAFIALELASRPASAARFRPAVAAGVIVALVCLVRSVATPLLPLGALLIWRGATAGESPGTNARLAGGWRPALAFLAAALLTIAPWTIRNAVAYGGLILIDTTGQENLWLDNDPAGREHVKAQLYAMGDDRAGRAQLATSRGLAAIAGDPGWMAAKSWREFRRFWALEHADDMLQRPAIWVAPAEVWLRLILGDGLWLVVLLGGAAGLALLPLPWIWRLALAAWALYIVLTGALFHVEYRYRLPLYPVLLPCAAWTLVRLAGWRGRSAAGAGPGRWWPGRALALALGAGLLWLTLDFGGYPAQALRLGQKHLLLSQAEEALAEAAGQELPPLGAAGGGVPLYSAQAAASRALQLDPRSVLARSVLARADLAAGQPGRAEEQLRAAIGGLPAHPYPHLLLGDLLRARGEADAAKRELAYETASGEDLQAWARARLTQTPPGPALDLGGGLDLGFIGGFYAAEADGTRWMGREATITLARPPAASALVLRLGAGRPPGASLPPPELSVLVDGAPVAPTETLRGVPDEWSELRLPLPPVGDPLADAGAVTVTLRVSRTFTPHDLDPANPDGRDLGMRLDWARIE